MLQKSTRPANPGDNRKWFLVDAKDQVLGRLAVVVANKLRAKDTPAFDPSVDAGAFVIVTNAVVAQRLGGDVRPRRLDRAGEAVANRAGLAGAAAALGERHDVARRPSGACSRRTRSRAR